MFIRTCPDCTPKTCIPVGVRDPGDTVYFRITNDQDVIYAGSTRDIHADVRSGVTYLCPQCRIGWNRSWAPWESWALGLARVTTIAAAGVAAWVLAPATLWPPIAVLTAILGTTMLSAIRSTVEDILDPAEHLPDSGER